MEQKKLACAGTTFTYVDAGRGEPILFVHGGLGDWRVWEPLRPFIAAKHRHLALSRRYHWPDQFRDEPRGYSQMADVDDIAAFIRALDIGRVHLVGSSYGATVCAYVALQFPELLKSAILSEPANLVADPSADAIAAKQTFIDAIVEVKTAAATGDAQRAAVLLYNTIEDDLHAFEKLPTKLQQQYLDNADTVGPTFSAPPPPAVSSDQLRAIQVPVLVLMGERSRRHFRYGTRALFPHLPAGSAFFEIPGAGHEWYPVNPQAGAKAIIDFVDALAD